jgi:hypothetical protein
MTSNALANGRVNTGLAEVQELRFAGTTPVQSGEHSGHPGFAGTFLVIIIVLRALLQSKRQCACQAIGFSPENVPGNSRAHPGRRIAYQKGT